MKRSLADQNSCTIIRESIQNKYHFETRTSAQLVGLAIMTVGLFTNELMKVKK
jgi:hypothetical protein